MSNCISISPEVDIGVSVHPYRILFIEESRGPYAIIMLDGIHVSRSMLSHAFNIGKSTSFLPKNAKNPRNYPWVSYFHDKGSHDLFFQLTWPSDRGLIGVSEMAEIDLCPFFMETQKGLAVWKAFKYLDIGVFHQFCGLFCLVQGLFCIKRGRKHKANEGDSPTGFVH